MAPGATWTVPAAKPGTHRTLYFFEGEGLRVAGVAIPPRTGAAVQADVAVELVAGPDTNRVLVLQARPIGEPVAQYGPFVANTQAEIRQAFADYQETGFGGWPWPAEGPVHPRDAGRFAKFPDGHVERPATP
jgi:redox-sensitive bicupin YhaK (pirin superfamily)